MESLAMAWCSRLKAILWEVSVMSAVLKFASTNGISGAL